MDPHTTDHDAGADPEPTHDAPVPAPEDAASPTFEPASQVPTEDASAPPEDVTEAGGVPSPLEVDESSPSPTDADDGAPTSTSASEAPVRELAADETLAASDEEEAPPPSREREAPDAADGPEEDLSPMAILMREADFMPGKNQRGDLVEGRVLRKDRDQIILDIGAKQEGIVPGSDLVRLPREVIDAISVGDVVQAIVIRPEGREGEVLVSLHQARTVADWDRANVCLESGEILELDVVGYNKGGVLVGFGNLQGFVPRSHLARPGGEGEDATELLTSMVGQRLGVKVIEVARRKRRLIMSERLAMREWRSERKKRLLDTLQEGETRRGRISSIADFGAFVDLGGADGLVHVSELTHERGKHPRDVVRVGQEVQVYVLSVDRDKKRIGLSMKRLQSDPWASVDDDHYVGELVEAEISNLSKFGAFARLEDGLEGLIHISELADHHIEHPREAVRPGQRVTVEIIAIEPERQRIGLSIRRVPPHLRAPVEPEAVPHAEPEPEPEPGRVAEPETEPAAVFEADEPAQAAAALEPAPARASESETAAEGGVSASASDDVAPALDPTDALALTPETAPSDETPAAALDAEHAETAAVAGADDAASGEAPSGADDRTEVDAEVG